MTLTVAFCCNNDRGTFTGRVVEVGIEDEIRLESPNERGLAFRITDARGPVVNGFPALKIGRRWFDRCGQRQTWVGNVFWDACGMPLRAARELAAYLIARGWTVVEHAEEGPLSDLVKR